MPETRASGVRIHYGTAGAGEPVVLIHGYSANAQTNWVLPGCVRALKQHFHVIAPDLRGHGRSEKPLGAGSYSVDALASDVLAAMDADGVETASLVGYSMGGMVALKILLTEPARVSAAVIGGMGATFPHSWDGWSGGAVESTGVGFPRRRFSRQFLRAYFGRMNPLAMLATYRGVLRDERPVDPARFGEIRRPVLCIAGTRDHMSEAAKALADEIPGAKLVLLDGQDHLSAPADPRFCEAIVNFLLAAAERA